MLAWVKKVFQNPSASFYRRYERFDGPLLSRSFGESCNGAGYCNEQEADGFFLCESIKRLLQCFPFSRCNLVPSVAVVSRKGARNVLDPKGSHPISACGKAVPTVWEL